MTTVCLLLISTHLIQQKTLKFSKIRKRFWKQETKFLSKGIWQSMTITYPYTVAIYDPKKQNLQKLTKASIWQNMTI